MNITHNPVGVDKDISSLTIFGQSLEQASANGRHQKHADFAEAYPTMEQHLARKVPQKTVLEKFNTAYGHGIHPPGFRKMLDEERKRRAESGEMLPCHACGKLLDRPSEATHPADNLDSEGGGI